MLKILLSSSMPLIVRITVASGRSVSNALVMAKLAVACTDERLYPRAVASFYFIHKAIADAVKQHEEHPGALIDLWAP